MPDVAEPDVPEAVRIMIVDDDALVRSGLAMMLDGHEGIEVVAEGSDGSEVAGLLDAHRVDVVLMDIRMPRLDGIEATARVRSRPFPPAVVVLTTFDSDDNIVHALRAGAAGFLVKDTPPQQIVHAVRKAAAGEPTFSPTVLRSLMNHALTSSGTRQQAREALAGLTEREHDVALAVAAGRTNAEIGADLYLSVATVKAHVSHVLTKLNLGNRTQVALLVHDAGLV